MRFHIGNLPVGVTKQELESFLLEKSKKKIESLTVEAIGKKGKNRAFALVSTNESVASTTLWGYLSYQGNALTIQKAGGFGASSWTKPKTKKSVQHEQKHAVIEDTSPTSAVAQQPEGKSAQQVEDETLENNSTFKIEKSMDVLLAEYGDYDPNWQKVVVNDEATTTKAPAESCLGMYGKAPIHIICHSFGLIHGIPNDRHELYYDCREQLVECPSYLQFLDGQTGAVKRALVNADARVVAKDIAKDMEALLKEYMENGFGYANPCQLRVLIASETGRHRSVVLAELAAIALRKILRKGGGFTSPVSVGCFHRDIQKRRNADSTKQDDDEDEKEIKARRLPQRAVRW